MKIAPLSLPVVHPSYEISKARYAKGMVLVRCKDGKEGLAGDAERLCRALRGRYTNRENGYVLSPTKAAKFVEYFKRGVQTRTVFDSIHSWHEEIVA